MAEPEKPIPPATSRVKNLDDMPLQLNVNGYEVAEWHRLPNGEGSPEAVDLLLHLAGDLDGASVVMRIRSRAECNRLIAILKRHRDGVWPVQT